MKMNLVFILFFCNCSLFNTAKMEKILEVANELFIYKRSIEDCNESQLRFKDYYKNLVSKANSISTRKKPNMGHVYADYCLFLRESTLGNFKFAGRLSNDLKSQMGHTLFAFDFYYEYQYIAFINTGTIVDDQSIIPVENRILKERFEKHLLQLRKQFCIEEEPIDFKEALIKYFNSSD